MICIDCAVLLYCNDERCLAVMQVESQHYSWSDVMKCVVSLLEMTFKPSTVAYRLAVSSRLRLFSLQAIADLLQCHCK